MPDIPSGNLRSLIEALHELHARAGWPSTRELSRGLDFSHTAVYDLFTKPTTAAPRLTVLLDVVERLAALSRRLDVSETLDKFDSLWQGAHKSAFTVDAQTAEIRAGSIAAELLAQMAEGKSESEAAEAIRVPFNIVRQIAREQILPLYNATSLEEAVFQRWRLGIQEVSTVRMLDLIADGKTEAQAAEILSYPHGVFEERRQNLLQLYDVDSLQEVVAEERRLSLRREVESKDVDTQEVGLEQGSSSEMDLPSWSELFPHGRHIFYEGDEPEEFARQVLFEFGFDVTKDAQWGDNDGGFTSYSFDCPPGLLNLIYGSDRFPMGS